MDGATPAQAWSPPTIAVSTNRPAQSVCSFKLPGREMTDPDELLLRDLRSRDLEAFERLYDSFGRRAFGLAYRLTGDHGMAQDVVQEAFLSIWQHAESLDPERGRFQPLLFAVVH